MADESVISAIKKEKTAKKRDVPQVFVVAANAFSVVYAVEIGLFAVYMAIMALVTGGFVGGVPAFYPFWWGLSAAVFGLVAFFSMKKITDREMLKKAYGIVAAFLIVEIVITATAAIAIIPYALFAAGAGGELQKVLWLNMFLPFLGVAAAITGFLFVIKKIYDGMIKLLPIVTYVILAIAGVAIVLAMIATFVGLYGKSSRSYTTPSYDYDFDYYLNY